MIPLHRLVADRAALTPDAVAVECGPGRLTYAELDARANRLANHLRGVGAGQETTVGVSLHRSLDLVVSLLAVWRTGAAYVPLDPDQPVARRRIIAEDTCPVVTITESLLAEWADRIDATSSDPVEVVTEPASAAYVVHTSGSTGRPKGVVVTHGGIANRVGWTAAMLTPADRVLQKTTIGFDAACWEFFAPLVAGATVVLAPLGAERDPAALARSVADSRATVLQGVPSVLRLLPGQPAWRRCADLRLIFSAGEPLHSDLCARLAAGLTVDVWNTYGPTECSIDVTAHRVDPLIADGPIPIGAPLPGVRLLVLDPGGTAVPVGVPGELHVGGVALARGYTGRPGLTADRFVPDPYGPPGARLYRTGDRVRWRADGTVEFVGRADDQIKVNGVRVEPGEVEAALTAHPEIVSAAVIGYDDGNGGRGLAAYLVGAKPSALRRFLADRLPDAMIPGTVHLIDALPLTPSGKIDRAALPPIVAGDTFVAPRTDAERTVAEVWGAVLGVDRVGAHDDFYRLGGSSLQLTRLAGLLGVPVRELFTTATVEEQAELLPRHPTRSIPVADRTAPIPLSFAQRRLWFLQQLDQDSAEWNSPVFVRLPGPVDADHLGAALLALSARHESLRTRYLAEDGEPVQVVDQPGAVEYRVADGVPLPEAFAPDLGRSFDLATGPTWRALLAGQPGRDQVVLLTLHHIGTDARTAEILERDLRELYTASVDARPVVLPDLPVQYADYAAWQRETLDPTAVAELMEHWRTALDGLRPLDLPLDRPRPLMRDNTGAAVPIAIAPDLTSAIADLARDLGTTPFATLLTAFATLLAGRSGAWDVPIGVPVAGRDDPRTENIAGLFLNPVVLRCPLDPEQSFADAVRRVRAASTTALAHRDLPFERIVDALVTERDLSRTPLYQVEFSLRDDEPADQETLAAVQSASSTTRTDLTLYLWPSDGGLAGALEYATALFDRDTVDRLAADLRRLISSAVADPTRSLAKLSELSEPSTPPRTDHVTRRVDETIPTAVAGRATACPRAVALGGMTRGEIDTRADQIAQLLHDAGVTPATPVAVLLDPGPALAYCALGVWRAGATVVPVEPSLPVDLIAEAVRSTGATLVLTESAHEFPGTVPTIQLDRHRLFICATPVTWPRHRNHPADVAYLVHRAEPAGEGTIVALPHAALAAQAAHPVDHHAEADGFLASLTRMWAELAHGPDRVPPGPPPARPGPAGLRIAPPRPTPVAPPVEPDRFLARFAAWVTRAPEATAVIEGKGAVTYREIDAWSNRIARAVLDAGGRHAIAAVAIERGTALLPVIIGLFKAGAVYVPLDPTQPADRLRHLLADSGAGVLVHDSGLGAPLRDAVASTVDISNDGSWSDDPPEAPPHDLAYVMYTSGSTGRPKGVPVGHAALAGFLDAMSGLDLVREHDRIIALTNPTFDISLDELLLPLVNGGCVVMAGRADARDGARLIDLVEEHRVTVLHGTPSTLRLMIEAGWDGGPVTRVLCGGEVMTERLADQLRRRVPEVWNLYGPTEATVWALAHRVTGPGAPPIGRPLGNATAVVLDEHGGPVQVGAMGELYLGGRSLAEGYLNRPELTDRHFVVGADGERRYRTGDRVSCDADGVHRFHGRLDDQVKLRGHRIEPGEIEAALLTHPSVAEAVVLVDRPGEDDSRLVALVRRAGGSPDADLRAHLARTLPDHMIPARFDPMPVVPLTPSGKVDRNALRARLDQDRTTTGYLARTEVLCAEALAPVTVLSAPAGPGRDRPPPLRIVEAIPGMRLHVLDERLRPAIVGELHVGGVGIALAHQGRPGDTATRFVPDPFGPPGSRLVRTGDGARRRADGRVELRPRQDGRIRWSGHIVRLDDIADVACGQSGVHEAVVLADGGELIAFHRSEPGVDPHEHCAARLPAALVPARFVPVREIPREPDGTPDTASLLGLVRAESRADQPEDAVEARIAEVWVELLGIPVDTGTSFFQLGGHSILAVRLLARLREEFDVDLPIRSIFERPTVAELAETVRDAVRAEVEAMSIAELIND